MNSIENIQTLCAAIDTLADARANLAVVNYRIKKGELQTTGRELGEAVKIVTEARQRLEKTAIDVLR